MTRARPTAQVLLTTDTGDPLLAINPYGLGQGLSFTGDLTPRWGGEWLAWPGFGKFWSQALRALVRRPNQGELSIQTTASPTHLHIELTEPSAANGNADQAAAPSPWRAESLDDTGHATPLPVRAVGVGRYEANVPLANADRVTVRLHDPAGSQLRTVQYDRPYPAEYLLSARPDPTLSAAAEFTPETLRQNLLRRRHHPPSHPLATAARHLQLHRWRVAAPVVEATHSQMPTRTQRTPPMTVLPPVAIRFSLMCFMVLSGSMDLKAETPRNPSPIADPGAHAETVCPRIPPPCGSGADGAFV